jgi:hypothetical protein
MAAPRTLGADEASDRDETRLAAEVAQRTGHLAAVHAGQADIESMNAVSGTQSRMRSASSRGGATGTTSALCPLRRISVARASAKTGSSSTITVLRRGIGPGLAIAFPDLWRRRPLLSPETVQAFSDEAQASRSPTRVRRGKPAGRAPTNVRALHLRVVYKVS